MADATAKYYFRFCICWCHCFQKVIVYQQTKYCRDISIGSWDITTFGFEIQTSAILEFYFRFRSRPVRRNLHVILYQAIEFRPNRSTYGGNMTSYPFLKMAAATVKYYFRFLICWCHCLQKVIVYQQTKYRRDISNGSWDITTFGFEIQTSATLDSGSGFDLDQFAIICMLFCIRLSNFVQIGAPTAEIWRHIHFSRLQPQPLNTTSSFLFVDVTAFKRSKSISKPNFVQISQLAAEI